MMMFVLYCFFPFSFVAAAGLCFGGERKCGRSEWRSKKFFPCLIHKCPTWRGGDVELVRGMFAASLQLLGSSFFSFDHLPIHGLI